MPEAEIQYINVLFDGIAAFARRRLSIQEPFCVSDRGYSLAHKGTLDAKLAPKRE
jgi:hypothetical protein